LQGTVSSSPAFEAGQSDASAGAEGWQRSLASAAGLRVGVDRGEGSAWFSCGNPPLTALRDKAKQQRKPAREQTRCRPRRGGFAHQHAQTGQAP